MDFQGIGWEDIDRINLVKNRDMWAVVNMVMNLGIP